MPSSFCQNIVLELYALYSDTINLVGGILVKRCIVCTMIRAVFFITFYSLVKKWQSVKIKFTCKKNHFKGFNLGFFHGKKHLILNCIPLVKMGKVPIFSVLIWDLWIRNVEVCYLWNIHYSNDLLQFAHFFWCWSQEFLIEKIWKW